MVSCLTSPLTKNKQEHPKNPVSLLLGLPPLQSGSGVNAVQPFYAPTAARSRQESTHEGGIWGQTKSRTKCDSLLYTWQSNDDVPAGCLQPFWTTWQNSVLSSKTCKQPLKTKALCVVNKFKQLELDRKFETLLFCPMREGFHFS